MRPDGVSSPNNFSQLPKSSVASSSQKAAVSRALNGQSTHPSSNGEMKVGRFQKPPAKTTSYFGHDREEVTRILIQSLYELGYSGSAELLSKESGYQLESPAVAIFRNAVLEGRWAEAERILVQSFQQYGNGHIEDETASKERLALVENADRNEMLFYLRQQKFLELLDTRDLGAALMVLRHELTPLNFDIGRLHALSSLLMCPPEHLHDQAGWDGSIGSSRERLLSELSKSISPSVMIPDNRLATLLDHVKQNQINQCLYHNTALPPSLYSDHMCDRNDFPLSTRLELTRHSDEVWHCQFSHDGTRLVTAGRDNSVIIYDTTTFEVIHKLQDHEAGVAHAVWSPDDSKLITCSQDRTARVWSTETGRCLLTINHHRQPVTAAVWAPNGESFVTASLDLTSQLCHWSVRGQPLHMWPSGFRVQDCAITPDGRRLIAVDVEKKIRVFNFITHEEEYILPLKSKATSIVVSKDSRHMLVNLTECQIQLIDIETTEVIRRFQGQKQSTFIIRSAFGGAAENFVVSGSEGKPPDFITLPLQCTDGWLDSRIYVWHKENGTLVETLEGHLSGCVNAISWNPADPGMFASAGDDCLVKIWGRASDAHPNSTPTKRRAITGNGYARTSALRSTSSF
ncbi:WD domain protein [Aspergillus germanicus]